MPRLPCLPADGIGDNPPPIPVQGCPVSKLGDGCTPLLGKRMCLRPVAFQGCREASGHKGVAGEIGWAGGGDTSGAVGGVRAGLDLGGWGCLGTTDHSLGRKGEGRCPLWVPHLFSLCPKDF